MVKWDYRKRIKRLESTKRHVEHLEHLASLPSYPPAAYVAQRGNNVYVKRLYRPHRYSVVKQVANAAVRRWNEDELSSRSRGLYKKVYDYWWEVD